MQSANTKVNFVVVELFLLSFVSLLLELLIIRWMSSEIRAFSIYKNFPLISCFVGLGYGFVRAHSSGKLFPRFPIFLFVLVLLIATSDLTYLSQMMVLSLRTVINFTWANMFMPPPFLIEHPMGFLGLSIAGFTLLMFVTAGTFACLGERIGHLFDQLTPLKAYLINIVGSAIGIVSFSILSYLYTSPTVWLLVALLPCVWVYRKSKFGILCLCLTVLAPLVIMPPASGSTTVWSPYYKIDFGPVDLNEKGGAAAHTKVGYRISVNKGFLVQALNLGNDFRKRLGNPYGLEILASDYEVAYQLADPKSVLVLGAGAGNDAAAALRFHVPLIDCVEIDPLVIRIGKTLHPENPYSNKNVRVFNDDARAYLRHCRDQYDLVSTGILDSHTVVGNSQSIRLDEYVYTVEGLTDLLRHMRPGGMLSIAYAYPSLADWIGKRVLVNLRMALTRANLPQDILVFKNEKSSVWHFIAPATSQMRSKLKLLGEKDFTDQSHMQTGDIGPSTDDWPYLYLKQNTFDAVYLLVNLIMVAVSWLFCGPYIRQYKNPQRWHLFCLGAGFLLMELVIIDRLALVFGSTWLVNSIGIFSIMVAIFFSNLLVIRRPGLISISQAYVGLLGFLLLDYLLPVEQMALTLGLLGNVLVTILFATPIFFAGVIFSQVFSQEKDPSIGLAFNIFGAMVGGLLEVIATYTGIKSLILIAALFYITGWLISTKSPANNPLLSEVS